MEQLNLEHIPIPFLQDGYMYYGHKNLYLNHPTFSQDHSEVDAYPSPYPFGDFNRGQIDLIVDMKWYFCGIAAATITNDYGFFVTHFFCDIRFEFPRVDVVRDRSRRVAPLIEWRAMTRTGAVAPGADSEEFSKIRMKTDRT